MHFFIAENVLGVPITYILQVHIYIYCIVNNNTYLSALQYLLESEPWSGKSILLPSNEFILGTNIR